MKIGIVGSESSKFNLITEQKARDIIREIIQPFDEVVSGKCHLGGIDIWAIQEALRFGKLIKEFPPEKLSWYYYSKRNLQIAEYSDKVVCITIAKYPENYKGMKFDYCYHCNTNKHVKSGGCWTVKRAVRMGKQGEVIVIN